MGDSKFSFFATDIIILLVFIGLIKIIFRFSGIGFLLELLFTAAMLLIAFIALIPAYSGSRGGWGFLALAFFAILLDMLAIYLRTNATGKTFMGVLLLSAIGMIVAVLNIKNDAQEEVVSDKQDEKAVAEEQVYTNFEPGKYVASKTGSTYHAPKCDWAKKIKRQNQMWLSSDEEAKKKGYKKHSCLE